MSKRKKKKNAQKLSSLEYKGPGGKSKAKGPGASNGMGPEDIMKALNECTECSDSSPITSVYDGNFKPATTGREEDDLEWMIDNLPTLPYVTGSYLDFMFSNGLTTGDPDSDDTQLKDFLYKQNIKGIPNYQVLRNAILHAKLYGKCGLRWLSEEDGLIMVPHNSYVTVLEDDDEYGGIRKPVCYAMSFKEGENFSLGSKDIELDEAEFLEKGRLMSKDKDIVVEMPENFVNLRCDLQTEEGVSCLMRDKQRLEILCNAYQRLNYDIKYDGPGRLIFWMKDDPYGGAGIDHSAGEIVNNMSGSRNTRAEKARAETEELGRKIKDSGSDSVVLAPNIFEDMDHLPRVTKATEFLDYLTMKEGSIIAQCLGITPELIGLGDVSGNVSMEKIIDNAMSNTIVPERELFATQFSPMLAHHLGFKKVFFDKYELKQSIDRSAEVYKLALSIAQFESVEDSGGKFDDVVEHLCELIMTMM